MRRAALVLALPAIAVTAVTATTTSGAAERKAELTAGQETVRFNKPLNLRGSFPGAPNATVSIMYRRAGADGFRPVKQVRTGADERWSARVHPRRTGVWRARLAEPDEPGLLAERAAAPRTSEAERVRVRSVTRAKVVTRHAVRGEKLKVRGVVKPRGRRAVVVRVGGQRYKTKTNRKGRFAVSRKAKSTGTKKVVVRSRGNAAANASRDRAGRLTVYRKAYASWYGPGFFGNRTACGQTLRRGTLGVAHKTMPCGTKLKLRNAGKTVTVRVIDRGPYVHGREFDLTQETKERIGFGSTGTVLSSR